MPFLERLRSLLGLGAHSTPCLSEGFPDRSALEGLATAPTHGTVSAEAVPGGSEG